MEPYSTKLVQHSGWSTKSLVLVIAIMVLASTVIVLATAPFATILGPSAYALTSALHGLAAFVLLVVATVSLYLAWRLYAGRIKAFSDLQLATAVMSALTFITIVFGNWIYVGYRSKGGVREWLLANNPEAHKIFFEFKEYMALFTLPLAVLAAYLLIRYDMALFERRWLRVTVAVILALTFFYFTVAFGLGAAITKIKPV